MSSNIRKCVCFGPDGFETAGSEQNYLYADNRALINDSTTLWTRLWINWRTMDSTKMARLDAQINQLNADRRPVILAVNHEFPTWLEGGRGDIYLIPNNRGVNSDWGNFVRSIYTRYMPKSSGGPTIHMLELVNEPNIFFHPNDAALPGKVVEMLRTAQAISAEYDHVLFLGGPALADTTVAQFDWRVFHDRVRATGWKASSNFVWTHHNYNDVETVTRSTRDIRDRIWSWWTGYDEGDGPVVFCTEGGARLAEIGAGQYTRQSTLVSDCFDRALGLARVGMQTNFLMHDALWKRQSDGTWHEYSGLRHINNTARPVYNAWKFKNTGYPDLYRWRKGHTLPPWTMWDPAMLSRQPGHLEVFAIGGDNACWHNWTWDHGNSWSGWYSLGGGCTSAPGVVSLRPDLMDMFVLGDRGELWHRWHSGGVWHDWYPRQGSCTYDPAPASWNDQHLDVFVRWADGTLWHRWWTLQWNWSNWEPLFGGQVVGSPSAVCWGLNRIDVVFRGTDDRIHHIPFDNGWQSARPLPGAGGATGSPEITSWKAGHLDVVCPGAGGKLHRITYDRGVWSDWEPIPFSDNFQWSPAATSYDNASGRLDVMLQRNNQLHHIWRG